MNPPYTAEMLQATVSRFARKLTFFLILLVIVIWFLGSAVFIVGPGEVGVITQFGRVTGRELGSGLGFKAPWPIQGVQIFNTQIQKDQALSEAASADLQVIHSTLALNYNLDPVRVGEIYRTIGTDVKERIVDPAVQEAFKAVTAQYTASDLLTKRSEVKQKALSLLINRLNPKGVIVDDLSIVNFNFSDDFNKAIEAKQVAQQQAEQAQYHLEQAQKDAQAQAAQKDSLTTEILQQQAINKWDGHMPQYVGSGSVFNIPLTK